MHESPETLVTEHCAAKQAEPTDPLELRGTAVPGGDPELLARCLVEELAAMGHSPEEIHALFRNPAYRAAHAYYQLRSDGAVRELIAAVVGECGVFRVTEVHADPGKGACPHGLGPAKGGEGR